MSDKIKKPEDNVLNTIGIPAGTIPTVAAVTTLAPFVVTNTSHASTVTDSAMVYMYIQFYNQAKYLYRI